MNVCAAKPATGKKCAITALSYFQHVRFADALQPQRFIAVICDSNPFQDLPMMAEQELGTESYPLMANQPVVAEGTAVHIYLIYHDRRAQVDAPVHRVLSQFASEFSGHRCSRSSS